MVTTTFKGLGSVPPLSFYCGLDIHKRQLSVAIYARDTSQTDFLKSSIFSTNQEGLEMFWNFCNHYHPQGFAMEATGIYHHTIAQFLEQKRTGINASFDIVIVNPGDATGIPGRQKTDSLDAKDLARYLAAGLLKGGRPIIPVLEDLKGLFRMIARLEKDRTALKNRIIKTLDRVGFRPRTLNLNVQWINTFLYEYSRFIGTLEACITQLLQSNSEFTKYRTYLQKILPEWKVFYDISLSSAQKALIRQDLYDLDLKTSRQTLLKVEIENTLQNHPIIRHQAHLLSSIPGITPYSALWILTETGGLNRFHSVREFQAYCGCVPRTLSTAGKVYSAHVSRHSNKFLRGIFYHAATAICIAVKKASALKSYADRLYSRKNHIAPLAFSIIGAKIARIAYAVLKTSRPFSTQLATNKHELDNDKNTNIPLFERKDLQKAKHALKRIQELKGLEHVTEGIENLVTSLEEILAKK